MTTAAFFKFETKRGEKRARREGDDPVNDRYDFGNRCVLSPESSRTVPGTVHVCPYFTVGSWNTFNVSMYAYVDYYKLQVLFHYSTVFSYR